MSAQNQTTKKRGNKKQTKKPVGPPHVQQARNKVKKQLRTSFGQNAYSPAQGAVLARQMAIPAHNEVLFHMPTIDMPKAAIVAMTTAHDASNPVNSISPVVAPAFTNVPGDLVVLMYGLPGFSYMYGPVIANAATGASDLWFQYPGSHYDQQQALNSTTVQKGSSITMPWSPVYCYSALQGSARPLGVSCGRTFAWFEASHSFAFYFKTDGASPATLPLAFSIDILRWQGPGEQALHTQTMAYAKGGSPSNSLQVSTSGWYTFDFVMSALDTDTFTTEAFSVVVASLVTVANPPIMHLMYPEEMIKSTIGTSIRRTAASLLVTNTSAEINKQGSVIAARLLNDALWNNSSELTISHLARAADKYTGQAANGIYTYMDFDNAAEKFTQGHYDATPGVIDPTDKFKTYTPTLSGPVFDMDFFGYIHFLRITNPTTTSPNNFLFTYDVIFEFRTDSMLYPRSVPTLDFHSLVEARRVNNSTMYFYENPLHFGDIWSHIKRAFNVVRKGALPLGVAASAMFPEASGAIMPFARALQS